MKRYAAPWSKSLIVLSAVLSLICLMIGIMAIQRASGYRMALSWLPTVLAMGCALFSIRGYSVTPDAILIHRLLWTPELPRGGLDSARFLPHAMRWSIRTFGNGGFFSFSGFYWSKVLGAYRAYVTDPARTVVLHYSSCRTVLLSPDTPENFVHDLGLDKGRSG